MRTYERPMLLSRALLSVASQSFSQWKLIVVNNGGERGPVDSAVNAASRTVSHGQEKMQILHLEERVGMETASNFALRDVGSSDYFVIHDDDDSWLPDFLDTTVSYLDEYLSYGAVVTGVYRVSETLQGNRLWPVKEEKFFLSEGRLTFRGMIGGNTFPPIAGLFRTRLLSDVGLFNEQLPVLGDWEFNLRVAEHAPFGFIPERLAKYHIRTPESDGQSANSITAGLDLHRSTKLKLQDQWLRDDISSVNKGFLSIVASLERDLEDARRKNSGLDSVNAAEIVRVLKSQSLIRKFLRGLRNPRHGYQAIRRRID
jgi:GT2 family glycosyltransferase